MVAWRVALALALVGAAAAAEPFVEVEQRFLRPSLGDPDYTVLSDSFSSSIEDGSRMSLTYATARSTAVRVGVTLPGGDRVEAGAWVAFERAAAVAQAPAFGSITDSLYPTAHALGAIQGGQARADGEVRAWTLDADYAHRFALADPAWSIEATFGLRRAGLRDDFAAEYDNPSAGTTRRFEHISDAVGTGPRLGARLRRGFLESRVGISAGAGYALLRGRIDTSSAADRVGTAIDEIEDGDEVAGFAMLDVSLALDVDLGAGFALSGAYRVERWDGMLRFDRFNGTVIGQRSVDHPSATWDGYVVALSWTSRR